MGYYTRYKLSVSGENAAEAFDRVVEVSGYDGDILAGHQSAKWYSYEEDLKTVAEEFPRALFVLSGEGEKSGDVWRMYAKHGEKPLRVRPIVTWPDAPDWAKGSAK